MDSDPSKAVDIHMEDDNNSVQECTEYEVDDLLGPRSKSGLSDSLGAVSLEVCFVFKTKGVYKGVEYTSPPPTDQKWLNLI